ncbi:hybrid sensor histidine kinase/response regulator [Cognatilysobacter tabacisoli]|uniref:hybrid sensor histidine kinase/response regulator n=1 Tax=Cognatilysobacter tabacisoli TaxID=2315424 RepID=UPI000E6B23A3|nr:two-component regulator propeller domain-containing protein [Lysobacter tabacisoli]
MAPGWRIGNAWRAALLGIALWSGPTGHGHAGVPETPRLRQLTVADGLPSNRINGIAEDRSGYLWIATSDGLARYDGARYRIWRSEDGLGDSFVWSVHVDARDRVWVATASAGLVMLDASRTPALRFDRRRTPLLQSNDIWAVTSTPDGAVWAGTAGGGLYRVRADPGTPARITRFLPRAGDRRSLPDARVSHLVTGPDGTLWVGTKGGVARWTGTGFERLPPTALPSPTVNALTADADGALWISTARGASVRRPDGRIDRQPWGAEARVLHTLLRDRSGRHWLDIPEGLGHDGEHGVAVVPLHSPEARGPVRPAWLGALEDRHGGLWFASAGNGLWHLPASWRQFAVLSRVDGDDRTLANAHVRGIASARDGSMWLVGSGGVLDRLDPETGAIEHVVRDVGDGALPVGVFEDRAGTVWVGYHAGIAAIRDGRVRRWGVDDPQDPAPDDIVFGFAEDGEGGIWIASIQAGVQARDRDGRVLVSVRGGDGRGLPSGASLQQIGIGADGAPWLAGSHGLSMWDAGARRFTPVPGAPAGRVCGFALAPDGDVWLAGVGELSRHRWDGERLQQIDVFGAEDGMPVLAPSGLTLDGNGIVWVTTTRGLLRLDPATRALRRYGVRSGLPSQEFDSAPVARVSDGRLLVGHPEGLLVFDPAVVRPATVGPPVAIETVDARRGDARAAFDPSRPFVLAAGDRDLRVIARLLSFDDARSHAYRFRLDGHDSDWVEVGADGERVFSRLAPGAYALRIKARAADNAWSPVRTLSFRVAAPWWRTWPALFGAVGCGLLLAWWIADGYRTRIKRRHAWKLAQRERELATQASLAKTRFLATLGHEVRTPMTGVLGMSELLLATELDGRQRGYVRSIHAAGEHLVRLVNDALDLARIESGKLELSDEPIDLFALVDEVVALMAPLARQRGLAFEREVAADGPRDVRGDPARLRQILMNLVGNAIKFTERGTVTLRLAPGATGGVRLEVVDTGPGLNEEHKVRLFRRFEQADGARTAARYGGSGLGLAICQELAAAMGGTIAVDSAVGHGTRFAVDLPLPVLSRETCADTDADEDARTDTDPGLVATGPTSASDAARAPPCSLLLVEDDPTVADVVAGLLRAQGHRVVHAAHALAALAEASPGRFDAGLLDLDLPGMDGFALARQLRAQGLTMPLVAITARADAEAEPLARAAGFDRFIRKPVTGARLAALVDDLAAAAPP